MSDQTPFPRPTIERTKVAVKDPTPLQLFMSWVHCMAEICSRIGPDGMETEEIHEEVVEQSAGMLQALPGDYRDPKTQRLWEGMNAALSLALRGLHQTGQIPYPAVLYMAMMYRIIDQQRYFELMLQEAEVAAGQIAENEKGG